MVSPAQPAPPGHPGHLSASVSPGHCGTDRCYKSPLCLVLLGSLSPYQQCNVFLKWFSALKYWKNYLHLIHLCWHDISNGKHWLCISPLLSSILPVHWSVKASLLFILHQVEGFVNYLPTLEDAKLDSPTPLFKNWRWPILLIGDLLVWKSPPPITITAKEQFFCLLCIQFTHSWLGFFLLDNACQGMIWVWERDNWHVVTCFYHIMNMSHADVALCWFGQCEIAARANSIPKVIPKVHYLYPMFWG